MVNINTKEYWNRQYSYEIEKGIDQQSDPIGWDLIIDKIKEGDNVLDFGCGKCEFLRYLLNKKSIGAYGVDHAEIALAYGFKQDERLRLTKSLKDLPVNSFDVITILHTIEHFDDPIKVILELKNFLKPNGILIITWPIEDKPWPQHVRIWKVEDVIELLEGLDCMYKILHRKEVVIPKGYRGFKDNHTLQCYEDGTRKKEAIVFLKFDKDE